MVLQGPDVIPIPGTTSIAHLDENLAARSIALTAEDLAEIDKVRTQRGKGGSYWGLL